MIDFSYVFKLHETDKQISYNFSLDSKTTSFIRKENSTTESPAWASIDFCPCSHCPFDKAEVQVCPIAKNINDLVHFFKDYKSYAKTTILVKTAERSYFKDDSIQTGLFSIFGVIMATSGCPHMDFLKPMARFHLPFASVEETLFRSVGTFLIGEYLHKLFIDKENIISLDKMLEHYKEVEIVNEGILNRIRSIATADADQNALVILNTFAQLINMELTSDFDLLADIFNIQKK